MLSKIKSSAVMGVDGFEITVEVSSFNRLPKLELVGLPDAAIKESKNRVQSALENSGIRFPSMDIVVNLAPADVKKEGTTLDLPILVGILQSCGLISADYDFSDKCIIGELSLSGEVRKINGVLPMTIAAKAEGKSAIFVPKDNLSEAGVVEGIDVYGVGCVRDLLEHIKGTALIKKYERATTRPTLSDDSSIIDFSDVRGQYKAKRALEIAAAGGHNILMLGPPGAGKSMLAKRIPTILPDMSFNEMLETSKVYSVMGLIKDGLVTERPFRSPHHTVSPVGMIGGGTNARPGEISVANNGVLFLDELPEFPKSVTEALRQPMEDGVVTITRAKAKLTYPSSFMLVAAMNPCKCGYFGDESNRCTCTPESVRKYLDKISGPLLDRIDIEIELPAVTYDDISGKNAPGEPSSEIRKRVNAARKLADDRLSKAGDTVGILNAKLSANRIRKYCKMTPEANSVMREAFESLGFSARAHDKVLRVARTIADLGGSELIEAEHISEAIMYRSLDRKYWNR